MFHRNATASHLRETCFLWGPRQSGKSTLLRSLFPDAPLFDLLRSSEYRRLSADPEILTREILALGWQPGEQPHPIIIDEVQKLPELLDEVHAAIEGHGWHFILTGSSPRKLLRGGGNLLGGRALRRELFPLVSDEIPDFSLERALQNGCLPRHYLVADARERLAAYVGDYLQEEILAEALTRDLPSFQRVLEAAAMSNGGIVNFSTIARDVGVAANTVKSYFEVLVDTLIATWVPAWRKRAKRRVIQAPRFFFFDVGVTHSLAHRSQVHPRSAAFGDAFEHFVFLELRAHASYSGARYEIHYWRTASGIEVDFILGDGEVAVEVKSTDRPNSGHTKGLRAWREEHPESRCILVTRAPRAQVFEDGIEALPWQEFLGKVWAGEIAA